MRNVKPAYIVIGIFVALYLVVITYCQHVSMMENSTTTQQPEYSVCAFCGKSTDYYEYTTHKNGEIVNVCYDCWKIYRED